jgi:pyroglutamyl-peptidase
VTRGAARTPPGPAAAGPAAPDAPARVLVTGFEPFRRWTVNSSAEAARALAAARPGLAVAVLPVDHDAAPRALAAAVAASRPDILLLTGLADEPRLRLELVARRPAHVAQGPQTLRGLWPWSAALDAVRATGAPARLSDDAGRYVCDTAYWAALAAGCAPLTAFLHVPPPGPDWPTARLAAAVAACLGAAQNAASASKSIASK